jgi:thiamine biosynthesis lipoprotein
MTQAPPFTLDVRRTIQGIDFQIAVIHDNPTLAEYAVDQAFRRIEGIIQNMDAQSKDGELATINEEAAEEPVPLSDDMYFVLKRAEMISIHSTRAFDVTVGPIRRMWLEAVRKRDLPSRNERQIVKDLVSFNYLEIDDENRTIRFKKPGVMIDLTGLLRGFAVDQGARVLEDQGIEKGFVRSREVYHFIGRISMERAFQAAIIRPVPGERSLRFAFSVDRPGCATYGYFMANVSIQGQMITEGIDGRTGDPAINASSCTVVGPDAMTSQMLAHAVCALGADKAYRFVNKFNPEEKQPEEDLPEEDGR